RPRLHQCRPGGPSIRDSAALGGGALCHGRGATGWRVQFRSCLMNRIPPSSFALIAGLGIAFVTNACSAADGKTKDRETVAPNRISVAPVDVVERPIARFIHATGTLMDAEQAGVAPETDGGVGAPPVAR